MPVAIFPATVAVARPATNSLSHLSSISFLSGHHPFHTSPFLSSTIAGGGLRWPSPSPSPANHFVIRMGGGPRTYPGGVTRWQWKRMQAKKAKQLLKARLLRERQLYEMRKRAELKEAAAEFERPWEVVERAAPSLFSVGADEQVKALADRFQRPGGFDIWSERDGPQVFRSTPEGLPSARFFPKDAVHSVKPYGIVGLGEFDVGNDGEEQVFDELTSSGGGRRRMVRRGLKPGENGGVTEPVDVEVKTLEEASKHGDTNLSICSKNSRFSKNFDGQHGNAVVDRKVSREEDLVMDSRKSREANSPHLVERSKNHGNGRRQGLRSSFSSNEVTKPMQNCTANELNGTFRNKNKKMGDGRQNSGSRFSNNFDWRHGNAVVDRKVSREEGLHVMDSRKARETNSPHLVESSKNHVNGRRQVSRSSFSSNEVTKAMQNCTANELNGTFRNTNKKMGNGRQNSGSRRSKMERISLRPTTELYHKENI